MKSVAVICSGLVLFALAVMPAKAQVVTTGDQIDAFLNPQFPSGFQFRGAGARALGMGLAYSSLSDDITALTWNPAGLLGVEKPALGLEFRRIGGKGDITAGPSSASFSDKFSSIHLLSFGMQIRIKNHPFGIGLAVDHPVQEIDELKFSRSRFRDNSPLNTDTTSSEYSSTTVQLAKDDIMRVLVGLGTRVSGPLSAGLSLTFYTGNGSHHNFNTYRLRNYQDPTSGISIQNQLVTYEPTLGIDDTVSYSGNAIQLGLRYTKPTFRLSATATPGHTIRFQYNYIIVNNTFVNGLSETVGFDTLYRDEQVTDFKMPWIITLGGSADLSKDLICSADFESRSYGSSNLNRRVNRVITSGPTIETFQESDANYQDAISIRLGGEYWLRHLTEKAPGIALRAGFRNEGMAAPEVAIGIQDTTATVTLKSYAANSFSVGAGVWFSLIHLDAALAFTSFTKTSDQTVPDVYSSIQRGITNTSIVHTEYKANFPTFRFTFTGVF